MGPNSGCQRNVVKCVVTLGYLWVVVLYKSTEKNLLKSWGLMAAKLAMLLLQYYRTSLRAASDGLKATPSGSRGRSVIGSGSH